MDISLFDYELDIKLIAQSPCFPRDNSRLLSCLDNVPQDLNFKNLPEILSSGDVLIVNDTKVIPSRLFAKRDNVNIEVTLHLKVNMNSWRAFLKPGRKCKINDELIFKNGLKAIVINKFISGDVLLKFNQHEESFLIEVNDQGVMPLPPYIKRDGPNVTDKSNYQTIFASAEGAVAAPTAGLHFTDELISKLEKKGIVIAPITLHVGAGTFSPIREDIENHKMHSEFGHISKKDAETINECKQNGGRIIAVGTTTLRLLESAAINHNLIREYNEETDIFIKPGFKFNIVDVLLTNFHLPKSSLLLSLIHI